MRSRSWARWASCALVLSLCIPAFADHKKSLASCALFDQTEKGEEQVEFTIRNSCSMPVDCAISWRVICAPDSRKRRSVHPGASKLALTEGATQSASASASVCGDDGWTIDSINWSCQPNKD